MTDPTRLIELEEGTSALERRVLDAARGIAAPPGMKASVLVAISTQAALGASASASVGTAGSWALVVKSLTAGLVIGVAATAAVTSLVSTPSAPQRSSPAVSRGTVAEATPGSGPLPSPTAPLPPIPEPTAEPIVRRADRAAPVTEVPAAPAPAPAARSQSAFSDEPLEPAGAAPGASAGDRTQLESRRVAEARGLLRAGRAAAALAVLAELARDLPNGVLAQEREALTIQARLGLGQREQARSLALEFLRRHPDSALAASVRRALD